ncbi:MAG: cellulase family glycosylhydrolase, partial [Chitinivibrionales bacterium]|nr:cellulase family glycosylhydrolase [Chitinivibrionales bacterium]
HADTTASQFNKFEISAVVGGTYSNPFDSEEIYVNARFTAPSRHEILVPGFFLQRYEKIDGQTIKKGNPVFCIRITPSEKGSYTFVIEVKDRTATLKSAPLHFTVTADSSKGFIRRSKINSHYFCHDNGSTFFPIGFNMAWRFNGVGDYREEMQLMASRGMNLLRIFLTPWNQDFSLEIHSNRINDCLPFYDLEHAWNFDQLVEYAQQTGIYILAVIEATFAFTDLWQYNPYNQLNGGPCKTGGDFFDNPTARRFFKNRLRYIAARYGYSMAIFAWELWNEYSNLLNPNELSTSMQKMVAWHRQMAEYLKDTDPDRHLITTSFGGTTDTPIDELSPIDFIQSHLYLRDDITDKLAYLNIKKTQQFQKPHFAGEFGLYFGLPGVKKNAQMYALQGLLDSTGVDLHNGLFSSLFSLSGSVALFWWLDYIHYFKLHDLYKPVFTFTNGIEFARQRFSPADIVCTMKQGFRSFEEFITVTPQHWDAHGAVDIVADGNGVLTNADGKNGANDYYFDKLSFACHSKKYHNPVRFNVDIKNPAKLSVFVENVSHDSYRSNDVILRMSLDGQVKVERVVIRGEPDEFSIQGIYTIDIPIGKHDVVVENAAEGESMIKIPSYILRLPCQTIPFEAYGLVDPTSKDLVCIAWFHSKRNTHMRRNIMHDTLSRIDDGVFRINGFLDGNYSVEWWNTNSGCVMKPAAVHFARNGCLTGDIPPFDRDIACKIRKQ